MKLKRDHWIGFLLFCFAVLVRLLIGIPGFSDPELLMRPDSVSYLSPASGILENGIYGYGTVPTALRVPGYPCCLLPALLLDGGNAGAFCILWNILLSSAAVPVIWFACREYGLGERSSLFGTLVYILTPTPAALAPMFLSDGLFGSVAALELLFLLRWFKQGKSRWLFSAAVTGGFGVLVRPLNLLWIFPCLFAAMFNGSVPPARRIRTALISLVLFAAVFTPWIFRNSSIGSGWRIDAVSADSLKHNAAVVESRASGIPAGKYRESYEQHFREVFASDPSRFSTEDSRLTYQEKYLSAVVKRHPLTYLRGFFHPVNYMPDIPSLLENIGLSRSGKGTWDVIINHGIFAGISHYFDGKYWLPLLFLPLCLLLFAAWISGIYGMFDLLRKKNWILPLLFLPFGLYYMTVTGPVAYPRFFLPVMPYLCILSAAGISSFAEWKNRRERKSSLNERID